MTNVFYNYNQLFNVMLFQIYIFDVHTLYQCYYIETILLEKSIKKAIIRLYRIFRLYPPVCHILLPEIAKHMADFC